MRRIFQIETQKWIDIRDSNLILTLQKLANYLTPYINEIVNVFINIFKELNVSEFVLSSALDALIEIVQKLQAASDIPSTHRNLIVVLMSLLRRQAPSINSITAKAETIETAVKKATSLNNTNVYSLKNNYAPDVAVKILILMGKFGVNSFPIYRSEKSTVSDPISDYDFRSPSLHRIHNN